MKNVWGHDTGCAPMFNPAISCKTFCSTKLAGLNNLSKHFVYFLSENFQKRKFLKIFSLKSFPKRMICLSISLLAEVQKFLFLQGFSSTKEFSLASRSAWIHTCYWSKCFRSCVVMHAKLGCFLQQSSRFPSATLRQGVVNVSKLTSWWRTLRTKIHIRQCSP